MGVVAVSRPHPAGHRRLADRPQLILRAATYDDLDATSRTHVELLPLGLFPALGARFVRCWHRTFLDSRYGVGYVAVDPAVPGDGLVGFLLGTTDQAAYTAALLRDRRTIASLVVAGVGALARRPWVTVRLLRSRAWSWARRLLSRRPASAPLARSATTPQVAVMVALAVRPPWRGSGVGGKLVARFIEHARDAGATTAELVTSVGREGATTFYERLGWQAGQQRRTPDGDVLRTYRRLLRDPPLSPPRGNVVA